MAKVKKNTSAKYFLQKLYDCMRNRNEGKKARYTFVPTQQTRGYKNGIATIPDNYGDKIDYTDSETKEC